MGHIPPPKCAGTTIPRIVLSTLAETSKEAEGLNLRAVGGKEWTLRIFNNGCLVSWDPFIVV
jgi:hypothetical protein